jgi:hypothetical protein
MRLLLHMLVVSLLAPSLGIFTFALVGTDKWADLNPDVERVFAGAIVLGLSGTLMAWFMVIPVGLLSAALCRGLGHIGIASRSIWEAGGIMLGALYGAWWAAFGAVPVTWGPCIGGPLGLAVGLILCRIWASPTNEQAVK